MGPFAVCGDGPWLYLFRNQSTALSTMLMGSEVARNVEPEIFPLDHDMAG